MEMCYNGVLVMPSNYAVVDADEMMYLEGGIKAQRYMKAGEAVKELAANVNVYLAISAGAGIAGTVTSVTGIGIAGYLGAIGAGAIASAMNVAYKQAKKIKKKYGSSRRVKITEELTFWPLGYTCTCKKA